MRSSWVVIVGVFSFAACAPRDAAKPVAAVDLVIPPIGPPAGSAKIDGCKARLVAGAMTKSAAGCYLDQKIEGGGTLIYPCTGDGPAEAYFQGPESTLRYVGQLRAGQLELAAHTELDWEDDGCRWATEGRIRGTLVTNGKVTKELAWAYLDRVLVGSGCSAACIATSSFEVHAE